MSKNVPDNDLTELHCEIIDRYRKNETDRSVRALLTRLINEIRSAEHAKGDDPDADSFGQEN